VPRAKVRIFIHDAALAAMNAPGGDVSDFVHDIAKRTHRIAAASAPRRSGDLARSLHVDRSGSNQFGVNYRVIAGVHYASWVSEGTTGPIRGHHGPMTLYKSHHFVPARYVAYSGKRMDHVRGQRANFYLQRALAAAMTSAQL
jgi:hypothetical protein